MEKSWWHPRTCLTLSTSKMENWAHKPSVPSPLRYLAQFHSDTTGRFYDPGYPRPGHHVEEEERGSCCYPDVGHGPSNADFRTSSLILSPPLNDPSDLSPRLGTSPKPKQPDSSSLSEVTILSLDLGGGGAYDRQRLCKEDISAKDNYLSSLYLST